MNQSPTRLDSLFNKYKYETNKNVKKFSYNQQDSDEDELPDISVKVTKKKKVVSSDSESEKQINNKTAPKNDLQRLIDMFPSMSELVVKNIYKKSKFNVNEAIEKLLQETSNDANKLSSSSTATSPEDKLISTKKRKIDDKENYGKEPSKKKSRVVRIESDSDADELKTVRSKSNKVPILSSDDDEDDENSKSSKTSSKSTSKTKKIAKIVPDTEEEDDDIPKILKKGYKKLLDKPETKQKSKLKKSKKKLKANGNESEDESGDEYRGSDDGSNDGSSEDEFENTSLDMKTKIVEFFNNSSQDDLASVIQVVAKKIEKVIELRPYKDFTDLQKKMENNYLGQLITTVKEVFQAREAVNQLMNKCEAISTKLQTQLSKFLDKKNTDLKIKDKPKILNPNFNLKPYQLIGLNWMCLMDSEKINGILADEMGLGKTIQAISFIAHLIETGNQGIHLIIVPPSTLDNWIREIETWCTSVNYIVYSGSQDERRQIRFDVLNKKEKGEQINIMLSTYSTISSTTEDKSFVKKIRFHYVVFDEAHMLKNMQSIRYQSLIKINSKRKLLLTGTPLQNNIVELMSLLNFVMPDIFSHRTHHIQKLFGSKQAINDKDTFFNDKIKQAKSIMRPFFLRRIKSEVLQQLPKKVEKIIECPMADRQAELYKKLIEAYVQRKEIKEEERLGAKEKSKKVAKNGKKDIKDDVAHFIMELRKAANHPLLRRSFYTDDKLHEMAKLIMKEQSADTVYEYVIEDMSVMSDFQLHKMVPEYKGLKGYELETADIMESGKFVALKNILSEKKANGQKCLIFSQFVIMLDILEDFLNLNDYKFCRLDGSTAVETRQDLIDEFNTSKDLFVFLLSTRAGGMGINLTSANVVILHDIDYNPFNDKQAEDRCHRVGQTREVEIYKLISKETIDESMLKIQQHKLLLGDNLTDETDDQQSKKDMVSLLKEAIKTKS